jgi:hypothetical protein
MRRALASVLSALLSLPLIAPAILANADSNLPTCCRRNGQHHCSMPGSTSAPSMDAAMADSERGPAIEASRSRCPYYPVLTEASGASKVASLNASQAIFASLISQPAAPAQTEARYRVSFSRSRHKRGPPNLIS